MKNTTSSAAFFDESLVRLQDNMYSFALSLTADRETAEDLRQETTLKVLSNRDKYRENTNFKGWVFTVMRNLFINNYHRIVRSHSIIDEVADLAYVGPQCAGHSVSTPYHEISIKEINGAIESLSDELRHPFSMFLAGFKYKEIADALELPIGTVKSRIFFARKQLQTTLADYVK